MHVKMWPDFEPDFSYFDSVMGEGLSTWVSKCKGPFGIFVTIMCSYFLPAGLQSWKLLEVIVKKFVKQIAYLGAVYKCQHFHECTNNTFLGGRGVCENQHYFHTLLPFWPDFYYIHGNFWNSKDVDALFFGGEGVSESVWVVHSSQCWHLWTAP